MEYIFTDLQNRLTDSLIINIFRKESRSPFSSKRHLYYFEMRHMFIWIYDIGRGAIMKLYSGHAMTLNVSNDFKFGSLLYRV